jgi:hypothetical protein
MELLKPYLASADDIGQKARIELANNARGIIHTGGLPILESAAQFVLESKIREWPELLDALRESLIYDGDEYPNDIRERIQGLIERCQPTNIESRLRFIVAKPSWNEIDTDESGNVTLLAEERARHLAGELSNDPESLIQHLHIVLTDEQRQGYVFGHELGTRIDTPLDFLVRGVNIIQSISPENRNPSVLLGLASATAIRDRDRLRQYLHGLIDDDDSRMLAVDLIRAAGAEDADIGLLVSLLLQGLIEASVLRPFAYGGALDGVTDTTTAKLAKVCLDNQDSGPLIALEILRARVVKSTLSIELLDIAKQILIHPLVLASIESPAHCYAFEQLAQKVILGVNIDKQFIQALTKWLTAGINVGINCRRSVQATLRQILEAHVDIAWPALCDGLQTSIEDPIKEHRIVSILGGYFDDPINLVELAGEERLLNWCAGWPKASVLVARLIKPLREFQEGEAFPSWTPFAIEFLYQNGSDSRVLTAVYANIQSGTWIGSMVPRLTRHRDAFKELTQHQNPDVVRWAVAVVNVLDAEIIREKKRDEEDEFGIR